MDGYLAVVSQALEMGIRPRCHLEDITRADFYGFVVPFVNELMELSRQAGIPVKIRACDTMGYGIPFSGVAPAQKRSRYHLRPSALFRGSFPDAGMARPQ